MKALRRLLNGLPGADELIIVSDQAMLSREAIAAYDEANVGFLGPLPTRKEHHAFLMEPSLDELKAHPLAYRPQRHSSEEPSYFGLTRPITLTGQRQGTACQVEAQALMLYSRGKARLDQKKRQTLLERYLKRLGQIASYLNRGRYKRQSYAQDQLAKAEKRFSSASAFVRVRLSGDDGALRLDFSVDEQALKMARHGDGRYLLVTNRALSADEMLSRFKEQDRIEKRISTIKGPIRIRPMFLHKQERIASLVLLCMVALMVFSVLEHLLGQVGIEVTGRHLLEQFASVSAVYSYFGDGSQLRQAVPLTDFQRMVLERLRFPPPDRYLKSILQ